MPKPGKNIEKKRSQAKTINSVALCIGVIPYWYLRQEIQVLATISGFDEVFCINFSIWGWNTFVY